MALIMKILVDADACPRAVLEECMRVGRYYSIPVWTVANFNHNIQSDHHIMVGNAAQEADLKIMNLAEPGDVVVTQDWGLAAMLLSKKVRCLSPMGREYTDATMDFMLEEREAKAKMRRAGGRTHGPRKPTPEDDRRFSESLHRIIHDRL